MTSVSGTPPRAAVPSPPSASFISGTAVIAGKLAKLAAQKAETEGQLAVAKGEAASGSAPPGDVAEQVRSLEIQLQQIRSQIANLSASLSDKLAEKAPPPPPPPPPADSVHSHPYYQLLKADLTWLSRL